MSLQSIPVPVRDLPTQAVRVVNGDGKVLFRGRFGFSDDVDAVDTADYGCPKYLTHYGKNRDRKLQVPASWVKPIWFGQAPRKRAAIVARV